MLCSPPAAARGCRSNALPNPAHALPSSLPPSSVTTGQDVERGGEEEEGQPSRLAQRLPAHGPPHAPYTGAPPAAASSAAPFFLKRRADVVQQAAAQQPHPGCSAACCKQTHASSSQGTGGSWLTMARDR